MGKGLSHLMTDLFYCDSLDRSSSIMTGSTMKAIQSFGDQLTLAVQQMVKQVEMHTEEQVMVVMVALLILIIHMAKEYPTLEKIRPQITLKRLVA